MSHSILDLDLGNTRLKWRYRPTTGAVVEGAFSRAHCRLDDIPVDAGSLQRVRIAAVAQGEMLDQVLAACETHWQVAPEIARVTERCAGVTQGYTDRSRLGVDRWLALLAAHHASDRACVVVSCGTAVTADLLTADGEHLGGYIAPGLELMREALFSGTHAVKLEQIQRPDSVGPGNDTIPAVNRGLVLMIKGLVEHAAGELKAPEILITGGDGERILPFLNPPFSSTKSVYRPNLVLDGLALALP